MRVDQAVIGAMARVVRRSCADFPRMQTAIGSVVILLGRSRLSSNGLVWAVRYEDDTVSTELLEDLEMAETDTYKNLGRRSAEADAAKKTEDSFKGNVRPIDI